SPAYADCPPGGTCLGDLNDDCVVDEDDLAIVRGFRGSCDCPCIADLNFDGVVDEGDEAIVTIEMMNGCEGRRPPPLTWWSCTCYGCSDVPCDPNDDPNYSPCQAAIGCLPLIYKGESWADLDGDGWPDAVGHSRDPNSPMGRSHRAVYWNDFDGTPD